MPISFYAERIQTTATDLTLFHKMGSAIVYDFSIPCSVSAASALAAQESKENIVPHVSVKMYPGRSEKKKAALAEAIAQDVMDIIGTGRNSISVAIEDISPSECIGNQKSHAN
jgi:phenylpyruvate tautomerase PptA (4-oxalocrotonate tautomerase family)